MSVAPAQSLWGGPRPDLLRSCVLIMFDQVGGGEPILWTAAVHLALKCPRGQPHRAHSWLSPELCSSFMPAPVSPQGVHGGCVRFACYRQVLGCTFGGLHCLRARAPPCSPSPNFPKLPQITLCLATHCWGGLGTGTDLRPPQPLTHPSCCSRGGKPSFVAGWGIGARWSGVGLFVSHWGAGSWDTRLVSALSGSAFQCPFHLLEGTPLWGVSSPPRFRSLGINQFARVVKGAALLLLHASARGFEPHSWPFGPVSCWAGHYCPLVHSCTTLALLLHGGCAATTCPPLHP